MRLTSYYCHSLTLKSAGIHLPSPNGLYDTVNPIDAFFHVGAGPILQVRGQLFRQSIKRVLAMECSLQRLCLMHNSTTFTSIFQIILGVGILEWINHNGKMTMMDMHKDSDREVGQFSLPIYGASQLKGKSEAQVADLKLKELKNGRLAMIGKSHYHYCSCCHYPLQTLRLLLLFHPNITSSVYILSNLEYFLSAFVFAAIGGLVHQTIVAGSETLGAFPNSHIWTL